MNRLFVILPLLGLEPPFLCSAAILLALGPTSDWEAPNTTGAALEAAICGREGERFGGPRKDGRTESVARASGRFISIQRWARSRSLILIFKITTGDLDLLGDLDQFQIDLWLIFDLLSSNFKITFITHPNM